MPNGEMIPARDFCATHEVALSFLNSLSESGLLQITTVEEIEYISSDQLPVLEKWVRLHYDMEINLEGLEAIEHLLEQIKSMQEEMKMLRSRLGIYELDGRANDS